MTFKKGQSGNPAGKPKGTRNKTTVLLEALLDSKAEELTKKAIQMAEAGDPTMMRLCLERLIPPRKDRPLNFDLPPLKTTEDASLAQLKILENVAKGELTAPEAADVSKIIENYADTVRLTDIEQRLAEAEAREAARK
jgi:hypothetical protein